MCYDTSVLVGGRWLVEFDGVEVAVVVCLVFFFKQKTAYEMLRSLVGSEMCIRDRYTTFVSQLTVSMG